METRKKYVVAVDAGTGACKAVVFGSDGKIQALSQEEWSATHYPQYAKEAYEFSPDHFFLAAIRQIRYALNKSGAPAKDICAVVITSQRQGMVFLDKTGTEIYAGPNRDVRAANILSHFDSISSQLASITGLHPHGMYGLARLKWFQINQPQIYEKVDKVLMICDWLAYRLCGECASEASVASSSQMFDIRKREFSGKVMKLAGLKDDIFPRVCAAGEPVGTITPLISELTGLATNTPVIIAGGDTQLGALGMGLCKPGEVAVIAGTTTPIYTLFDYVNEICVDHKLYTSCHVLPGIWGCEANAGSTGLSLRWCRDLFFKESDDKEKAYEIINAEAAEIADGNNPVDAYIGMELTGVDVGENLGGFVFRVPWNLSEITRGHIFRAALDTNLFAIRANVDYISEIGNCDIRQLSVCGGQLKNGDFAYKLANLVGIPIKCWKDGETTARGAAAVAFYSAGIFSSIQEAANSIIPEPETVYPDQKTGTAFDSAYKQWKSKFAQINNLKKENM